MRLIQLERRADHDLADDRVQTASRLIGKQKRRFGDKGARQRHALLFAAGEDSDNA